MLLTIDIGNTHTVLGVFEGSILRRHWRLSSSVARTEDECWILVCTFCQWGNLPLEAIEGVVISSVVPNLTPAYEKMSHNYLQRSPLLVSSDLDLGIRILYEDPRAVGADRLCNAVAGFQKYGGPLIVVDFGTATTFDVITREGDYLGGVIAPGIETSAMDLFRRAARLPRVELRFPRRVIGHTTETSMQSGIMFGALKQVEGLVELIAAELEERPVVIATGGLAPLISQRCPVIQHLEPYLTLEGMRLIYERVRGS